MFHRVADGAVNLESDASGLVRSIPARDLGRRDVTRGVGRLIANRQCGAVQQGGEPSPRETATSARWCFMAWKLSDDLAELLALLRVFGGDLEQCLSQALQLRGSGKSAHVEGGREKSAEPSDSPAETA